MKDSALIVLDALRKGPMTSRDIWRRLGIQAAPQRVCELRAAGCEIDTKMVPVRTRAGFARVAKYRHLATPRHVYHELRRFRAHKDAA